MSFTKLKFTNSSRGEPGEALLRVRHLLEAAALCSDSTSVQRGDTWSITGDPTEGALVVAARKAGVDPHELRRIHARVDAIPFESENQFMVTLHDSDGERRAIMKGRFGIRLEPEPVIA